MWVIKRGRFEYVSAGIARSSAGDELEWTDDQGLAHRFDNRNHAARIVGEMQMEDDVRVVRLIRTVTR